MNQKPENRSCFALFLLGMTLFFIRISWSTDNKALIVVSIVGLVVIWIASLQEGRRAHEVLRKLDEEDDQKQSTTRK